MQKYSVFVNTTDSFSDCWHAFFQLLSKYWKEFDGTCYLNTERENFVYEGLNIVSLKTLAFNKKWSDCLIEGLSLVKEDYILYMQEDYFIKDYVQHDALNSMFDLFLKENLDCLHLTDQCTPGPFNKITFNANVWEILPSAKYRVSTQAAFWKRDKLIQCLKEGETGWEFEKNAQLRVTELGLKIYAANQDSIILNQNEIIPYIFTGIIRGKWKKEVEPLFKSENIDMDFSARGFYKKTIKNRIKSQFKKIF